MTGATPTQRGGKKIDSPEFQVMAASRQSGRDSDLMNQSTGRQSLSELKRAVSKRRLFQSEEDISKVTQQLKEATRHPTTVKRMNRDRSGIRDLLDSVKKNPRFNRLIEYSLDCLENLCLDQVSAEDLMEEGTIDVLLDVLKTNPFNERISRIVNRVFQAMTKSHLVCEEMVKKNVFEAFEFSMHKHHENSTHRSTCTALIHLFNRDKSCIPVFASGQGATGTRRIMSLMKDDEETAKYPIQLISVMTKNNPRMAQYALDSGMVQDIIHALSNFSDQEDLFSYALAVFNSVAAAGSNNAAKLQEMGLVEVLLNAMNKHPDNSALLTEAAEMLTQMAGREDIMNAISLLTANDALGANSDASKIGLAISMLSNLAILPEHSEFIMKEGGAAVLVKAINTAVQMPAEDSVARSVIEGAIRAITRMAKGEDKVDDLLREGVLEPIQKTMKKYRDDPEMCADILNVLCSLLSTEKHLKLLQEEGILDSVFGLLKLHKSNERVVKCGIDFLTKAVDLGLHDPHVHEFLLTTLETFNENEAVTHEAIKLMEVMSESKLYNDELMNKGGVEALLRVLENFPDSEELVQAIFGLFQNLSMIDGAEQKWEELDVVKMILAAMEMHADNEMIQELGTQCIQGLSSDSQLQFLLEKINKLRIEAATSKDKEPTLRKLLPEMRLFADFTQVEDKAKYLFEHDAVPTAKKVFEDVSKYNEKEQGDAETNEAILLAVATALHRLAALDPENAGVTVADLNMMLKVAFNNSTNEPLAEAIVRLASKLATKEGLGKEMIANDIHMKLVQLAQAFPLSEKIPDLIVTILGFLTEYDTSIIEDIIKVGGHELLLDAAYASFDNPTALENAMNVIGRLAVTEEAVEILLQAGSLELIVKAMRSQKDNVDVQVLGLDALGRLAMSEETLAELGQLGVTTMLLDLLEKFPNEAEVVELSLQLLDSLCLSEENAMLLVDVDAAELIKSTIAGHVENTAIQEVAARVLEVLSDFKEKVELEKRLAVIESISEEDLLIEIQDFDQRISGQVSKQEALAIIDKIRKLATRKDAILKLAKVGGFNSINDLMLNQKDEGVYIATADAINTLLEGLGDDILDIDNPEQILQAFATVCSSIAEHVDAFGTERIREMLVHLGNLSRKKEYREYLLNNGLLDSILPLFQHFSEDPEILADISKLLGAFGVEKDFAMRFLKDGSIKSLIEGIRKFIEVERFERYAVYLLGSLAMHEGIKDEILLHKGVEAVAAVLKRWMEHQFIVQNCNFAFGNFSFNSDEMIAALIKSTALDMLIEAMHFHMDAPKLLNAAALVISNVCFGSDDNKRYCAEHGATRGLVNAVLRNFQNTKLLNSAFRAIGNIAFNIENIPVVIEDGGVQSIVAGLNVHIDNEEVITTGLGVLTNLAADSEGESQAIMAQEGAVQAICEVAKAYASDLDVSFVALGCLVNLSLEEYNAKMIVRQGGVSAAAETMMKFHSDQALMENASRLMDSVAQQSEVAQKFIHSKDVIAVICKSIERYAGNFDICSDLLSALYHLSTDADNATAIGMAGALETVLRLVQTRVSDLDFLKASMRALSGLTRSEYCCNHLVQRSIPPIVSALKMHAGDDKFMELVFGYIGNLCCFDTPGASVGPSGVIPPAFEALQQQTNRTTILMGIRALENIAYCGSENRDLLKRIGSTMYLEAIRTRYRDDGEIYNSCMSALDALNSRKQRNQEDTQSAIRKRLQDARRFDGKTLPDELRNMLLAGSLLVKHSVRAPPRYRHIFVSKDLKTLCWKDPKKPLDEPKQMKISAIKVITRGRCTQQLQRKRLGKHNAEADCCFACLTAERNLSLEAASPEERDEWINALNALRTLLKNKTID